MVVQDKRTSGEKSFDYDFDEREEEALRYLQYRQEDYGFSSFRGSVHDDELLPSTFTNLYHGGSTNKRLNADSVKHWAMDNGMSEDIADEMGYTCETVYHTLLYAGSISRSGG